MSPKRSVSSAVASTCLASVIPGLPAVLLATWIAIRPTRISFTDYLALRWTSLAQFLHRRRRAGHPCRGLGAAAASGRARGDAGLHGRRAEIAPRPTARSGFW